MSKPSSYRLLAGTNEYAEDLTGQRMPLNASQWRSETQVCLPTNLKRYFIVNQTYWTFLIFDKRHLRKKVEETL
jgi:hypothetical protein